MTKKAHIIEISFVYISVFLITIVAPRLVSLGTNVPVKMVLMLLPYILMVVLVLVVLKIQKEPILNTLGFQRQHIGKQIVISIPIFLITAFIFVVGPLMIGMDKSDVLSFKPSRPNIFVYYIFFNMIFVGLGEEIIFRGHLFTKLNAVFKSGVMTVIISSIMFGVWHYPVGHNILQVIMTSIIGFIYGISRLKIKNCSTLSVGIAHGLHDTLILTLSYILI
jgi:uncharacterized protein